jgi:hypothetical protein
MRRTSRFSLILSAALLFSGLLVFSILRVRYDVQGAEKSEFNIIEYTLTDSIKRGQEGGFVFTSVSGDQDATGKGEPAKATPEPCPT